LRITKKIDMHGNSQVWSQSHWWSVYNLYFRELLTVQNRIDAMNYALHLVHGGGADPNWMVPVHHLPMSEEECKRVDLPYGFDGVMFAHKSVSGIQELYHHV